MMLKGIAWFCCITCSHFKQLRAVLPSADWHSAQEQSGAADHSLHRKRCRQDSVQYDSTPLPPSSTLISSARDPKAPIINIVLRGPSGSEQSHMAGAGANLDHYVSETLSNNLASQCRSGVLVGSSSGPATSHKTALVLAAAKQAAGILKQHAQWQEQQTADNRARRAKQKHRYIFSYISEYSP